MTMQRSKDLGTFVAQSSAATPREVDVMTRESMVRQASPKVLRWSYREALTWYRFLRSRNKDFIRFAPLGHFYSPIPDMDSVHRDSHRLFDDPPAGVPGVDLNERAQLQLATDFAGIAPDMPFPVQKTSGSRYYLDNEWFSFADGVTLYAMMRHFTPRRIVEVGSGFSSAAMLDVRDRFLDRNVELTFIEPYPERLKGLLSGDDFTTCRIIQRPVQEVPDGLFAGLQAGDFLFVDSSHVAKTGSDVLDLMFRVLPLLRSGVVVHFHDIMWPFEYPKAWLAEGRAWNESYFVRSFLQYNREFEILFFNSFLAAVHRDVLATGAPSSPGRLEDANSPGSLWLRRSAADTPGGSAGLAPARS